MPTTSQGLTYPASTGHTRVWEHLQTLAEDTDVILADLNTNALTNSHYIVSSVSITPVANTPTSTTWTYGRTLAAATVRGFATATSSVPGSTVLEVSMTAVGTADAVVWVYRTTTTATSINVMAIGQN